MGTKEEPIRLDVEDAGYADGECIGTMDGYALRWDASLGQAVRSEIIGTKPLTRAEHARLWG